MKMRTGRRRRAGCCRRGRTPGHRPRPGRRRAGPARRPADEGPSGCWRWWSWRVSGAVTKGAISASKSCAITGIIARRTDVRKRSSQACFPAFRRPQNRDRRRIARTYASRERAWPSVTAPPAATATPATNGLVSNALVFIPIHWNGRRHAMDWYPLHWSPLHTNALHPQPRRRPDTRPGKAQTSHGVVSLQFR